MSVVRISMTIAEETLKKLDKKRGFVPRSIYVDQIILKHLKKGEKI